MGEHRIIDNTVSIKIFDTWWPAILALAIIGLDFVYRTDKPRDLTPVKALILTARSLKDVILTNEYTSKPLKSLIIHYSKPGNLVANLLDWLYETLDLWTNVPFSYIQLGWDFFAEIITGIDFAFVGPMLVEEVATDLEISEEDVYRFIKDVDDEFENHFGMNITEAKQFVVDSVVGISATELKKLNEVFKIWTNDLIETCESVDYSQFEDILLDPKVEELLEFATSYEVLGGISYIIMVIRTYFLSIFTTRRPPILRERYLNIDPSKSHVDNIVTAVGESIWIIAVTISEFIRGDKQHCLG